METPDFLRNKTQPHTLTPCTAGGRTASPDPNSPEFEFWRVRNPSLPPPNLLSADELFFHGVLLPLHLLPHRPPEPPDPDPQNPDLSNSVGPGPEPESGLSPNLSSEPLASLLTASKRWKDIFKKSDKKTQRNPDEKEKEKKKEKKSQTGVSSASAELNINIWPFSRSRSAGNGGTRPRMTFGAPGTRKVSSAPCSRSNSAGESKSRKWPSSPGRAGVHLGRSSPVWQVRRTGSVPKNPSSEPVVRNGEKPIGKKDVTESRNSKTGSGSINAKVLNLNVPTCIGYRSRLSCGSDVGSAIQVSGNSNISGGNSNIGNTSTNVGNTSGGNNLFSLRNFFTKKVY
ncbi:uncharacterized protein LOC110826028 [Carica papaya]|uniref:uncharacterized protein LOC110826028 n=1 Tax=Carica papaya TaxID=3649 RepID=UPI000B8C820F|nr:uncharacterized protein LOC110826028 [Carica papaya]